MIFLSQSYMNTTGGKVFIDVEKRELFEIKHNISKVR